MLFWERYLSCVYSLLVKARGCFHKAICCLYLSAAIHDYREHGCHISQPMSHLPGSDRQPSCFELTNVCQCHSWAGFTVKAEVYEFRSLLLSCWDQLKKKGCVKTSFFQTEHPDVCCSAPWSLKAGRKQGSECWLLSLWNVSLQWDHFWEGRAWVWGQEAGLVVEEEEI